MKRKNELRNDIRQILLQAIDEERLDHHALDEDFDFVVDELETCMMRYYKLEQIDKEKVDLEKELMHIQV